MARWRTSRWRKLKKVARAQHCSQWRALSDLILTRDVNVSIFLWSNSSFFIAPLKKNLFRFVFVWNRKTKKLSKYFDIKKDFFKLLTNFFLCFLFFVFIWERLVSSKQNLPNTTNLILSNWLNSMVVRLDISSNFLKNKPLLLFRLNPRRF